MVIPRGPLQKLYLNFLLCFLTQKKLLKQINFFVRETLDCNKITIKKHLCCHDTKPLLNYYKEQIK